MTKASGFISTFSGADQYLSDAEKAASAFTEEELAGLRFFRAEANEMKYGLIYLTALYMLLPLYSALEKLPRNMTEAAADPGAGPWTRFRRITLPMSLEGIGSGAVLVFLISTGCYGTPVLLGGPNSTGFAETIAGFFHNGGDEWPTGAAFAVIMFVAALAVAGGLHRLFNALRKGDTK